MTAAEILVRCYVNFLAILFLPPLVHDNSTCFKSRTKTRCLKVKRSCVAAEVGKQQMGQKCACHWSWHCSFELPRNCPQRNKFLENMTWSANWSSPAWETTILIHFIPFRATVLLWHPPEKVEGRNGERSQGYSGLQYVTVIESILRSFVDSSPLANRSGWERGIESLHLWL